MHARVTMIEGAPDRIDGAMEAIEEQVVPVVRDQSGFKGFTVLVDRSSGKAIGISFWDSEADMQASEEAVAGPRDRTAEQSGATGGARVERYEVAIDITA